MADKPDWMKQTAEAIVDGALVPTGPHGTNRDGVVEWIRKAIEERIPKGVVFMTGEHEPCVAYMPVPRCGTCLHWDNIGEANKYHGKCLLPDHDPFSLAVFTAMYTNANFGCIAWKAKV